MNRWLTVRRFLRPLLDSIEFKATEPAKPVLEAIQILKSIEGSKKPDISASPAGVVIKCWQGFVFDIDGRIDRRAYTFCVLERLSLCTKSVTDFCKINVTVHDICTESVCMALLHRRSNSGTSAWKSARGDSTYRVIQLVK